jgi:hypothetical protein
MPYQQRFLVLDGSETFNYNRASSDVKSKQPAAKFCPILLSVPDNIFSNCKNIEDRLEDWVKKVYAQKNELQLWSGHMLVVMTEEQCSSNHQMNLVFNSYNWNNVLPSWLNVPTDATTAITFVKDVGVNLPEFEPVISQESKTSYEYAIILRKRFEMGEPAIAKDAGLSCRYAKEIIGGRFLLGEPTIAQHERAADLYAEKIREWRLWGEFSHETLMTSPVWMYHYAKDFCGGRLPENLHNRMLMMSVMEPNNYWVKRYSAKKYQKKKRAPKANLENA